MNAPFEREGRLDLLARLVCQVPCRRLVDIGSDHATVPVELLRRGHCQSVLVTDIRQGPLSAAIRRARKAGLNKGFEARRTDGLEGIDLLEGDVLLISGLGGDTLAGILENQASKLAVPDRIIIQPQTKEEKVRAALQSAGREISQELYVRERDQLYLVMVSDHVNPDLVALSASELYFGPLVLSRLREGDRDQALLDYLARRLRRLRKQAPYDQAARSLLQVFEEDFPISYNELDWD